MTFAERALEKQSTQRWGLKVKYADIRYVIPTSNIFEILFSKIGHVLEDRRSQKSPANLGAQVFLHMSSDFWGPEDVNGIARNSCS